MQYPGKDCSIAESHLTQCRKGLEEKIHPRSLVWELGLGLMNKEVTESLP